MTDSILNMAAIHEAKETMKSKFPTMIEYFMEDTEMYINSIKDGMIASNAEEIIVPAHTLKSSSRQMGAAKMSDIAKEIEMLARAQAEKNNTDVASFGTIISRLESAFAETQEALKQIQA